MKRKTIPLFSPFVWLFVLAGAFFSSCQKLQREKPVAQFTTQKSCNGQGPCTVTFVNQSSKAESFLWKFGDGTSSVTSSPTHTYNNGVYYLVTLTAIGREEETTLTDTVFLVDKPACETRGSFACAKKLTSGMATGDFITAGQQNNYYYFRKDSAGAVLIELNPVPEGYTMRVELLAEANYYSSVIAYATGKAGDIIKFYAGPLTAGEYYLRINQGGGQANSKPYILVYTNITADPYEYNGTFSTATNLPFDRTIKANILAEGDEDFYVFNQSKAGVVDIKLSPVPLFANRKLLYIEVYDNASTSSLKRQVYRYPGEEAVFPVGPLAAGAHYIKVYGANGAESPDLYNLTIRNDTTDKYESNNTFATATAITLAQTYRASIKAAGDVDYYSFTASKAGTATVTVPLVPDGLSYMYVDIYSSASSGALIAQKYAYTNNSLVLTTPSLTAGQKYYLKAYTSSSAESDKQYEIRVLQ